MKLVPHFCKNKQPRLFTVWLFGGETWNHIQSIFSLNTAHEFVFIQNVALSLIWVLDPCREYSRIGRIEKNKVRNMSWINIFKHSLQHSYSLETTKIERKSISKIKMFDPRISQIKINNCLNLSKISWPTLVPVPE